MNLAESAPSMITLSTDFGLEDPYVGAMKGVILSINPGVRVIDIAHQLPAYHIVRAAYLLREVCPRFPRGTIHVAVIDPGVGGQRRPVLLQIDDRFYVGPDNGIFGLLLGDFTLQGAWRLDNPKFFLPSVSQTFHGRDIFAPVAAHLAAGIPPASFGPTLTDPVCQPFPLPKEEAAELRGQVVWVDRFGNCITNLADEVVSRWVEGASYVIQAASKRMTLISTSYESTPKGEALALFNSLGFLEIACNQAPANRTLGLAEGDPVVLKKGRTASPGEGSP